MNDSIANCERMARMAWSYVSEYRDNNARNLIEHMGACDAWQWLNNDQRVLPKLFMNYARKKDIKDLIDQWVLRARKFNIDVILEQAELHGIDMIVPGDTYWPQTLSLMNDWEPIGIWVRGNKESLHSINKKSVSIVGARASSRYGDQVSAELSYDLSVHGYTIVSGGAFGIDAMAHRGALKAEGKTVAVLAGGLERFYPVRHTDLFHDIMEKGCLVSLYPPGARPTRWRFLDRNRVIAGLTQGCVVVEAGYRSGALNTAQHARELGRHLGAVPGSIYSLSSVGTLQLIRHNATLISNAQEVIEMIEPISADEKSIPHLPIQSRLLDGIDGDQRIIFDAMPAVRAAALENIARAAGLSIEKTRIALVSLELEGRVTCSQGLWKRKKT
ncbi:MAG: DNA-processing protein DprA [Actinomycetaceae bacterium]|nr:DNA-processing protein DprA [Actinomycetaceae bacterium]